MPEGSRLVLPDADPAGRLRILRAVYGVLTEHPTVMPEPLFVDMAAPLAARIAGDSIEVVASNDLAGDPLLNVQKKLEVDYRLDGLAATARVAEGKRIEIGALRWATDPLVPRLVSAAGAGCTLEAWEGGRYDLVRADVGRQLVEAPSLPEPVEIPGPWQLGFPQGGGAPARSSSTGRVRSRRGSPSPPGSTGARTRCSCPPA
ncbi:MAG: hypothetical protein HY812_17085 [Planctomycetes bacterium]|nr:hypothetical protein [Planctomycetota bacterium]